MVTNCKIWEETCLNLQQAYAEKEVDALFRAIHTIKGNISTLGNTPVLLEFVHNLESTLEKVRAQNQPISNEALLHLLTLQSNLLDLFRAWDGKSDLNPNSEMLSLAQIIEQKIVTSDMEEQQDATATANDKADDQASQKTILHSSMADIKIDDHDLTISSESLTNVLDLLADVLTHTEIISSYAEHKSDELAAVRESIRIVKIETEEIKQKLTKVRSTDLSGVYKRLQRTAVETGVNLNKKFRFKTRGSHIRVDREIVQSLMKPLIHIMRNSVDHGLESEEKRIELGKDPVGTIEVSAVQYPHSIEISVSDDGAGIDFDKIKEKAIKQGIISETEQLNKTELKDLIFHPGFSTKDKVNKISGRGVGLDAARASLHKLGGDIRITGLETSGTKFSLHIPSKATLTNVVVCNSGSQRFAFALSEVEVIQIDETCNHDKLSFRDKIIPVRDIREFINCGEVNPTCSKCKPLIIARVNDQHVALIVDRVIAQRKIGIKKINSNSQGSYSAALIGWSFFDDARPVAVLSLNVLLEDSIKKVA